MSNSAKRILEVIDRIPGVPKEFRAETAWAFGFGIRERNSKTKNVENTPLNIHEKAALYRALGEIVKEIDNLEDAIRRRFESRQGNFLGHVQSLREYFTSIQFNDEIHKGKQVNDGAMATLHFLAELMGDEADTPLEEIAAIEADIQGLMREVNQSNELDANFKKWMLDMLAEALHNIALYRIHGGRVFRTSYMMMTGELVTKHEELEELAVKSEKGKGFVGRIMGIWTWTMVHSAKYASDIKQALTFAKLVRLVAGTPVDNIGDAVDHLAGDDVVDALDNLSGPSE